MFTFVHYFPTPHHIGMHIRWLWSRSQASCCLGRTVLISLDGEWRENSYLSSASSTDTLMAPLLKCWILDTCRGLLREPIRPGPQKSPLAPNAFVFREPYTSSKLWEKGHDIRFGCRVGQDYKCVALQCIYEPMGAALHGQLSMAPSSFPNPLGPSLTKSLRSILTWVLGHCLCGLFSCSIIRSVYQGFYLAKSFNFYE